MIVILNEDKGITLYDIQPNVLISFPNVQRFELLYLRHIKMQLPAIVNDPLIN